MSDPRPTSRFMPRDARIYVAGHTGLVGSAIHRALVAEGYTNILTRTRNELDLRQRNAVTRFFSREKPDFVFLAAAKVGGALANQNYPADFIRENLLLEMNLIDASRWAAVKRLLFLGSSCIYPANAPQPIPETCLLEGAPEATNLPYAVAKIAGIEMCWSYNRQYGTKFVAVAPADLYGPGDNFDLKTANVLPTLVRKTFEAKATGAAEVTVWGTGTPRLELLHSDDLADACVFLMNLPEDVYGGMLLEDEAPLLNIGTGEDVTVRELAEMVARVMEFQGALAFDTAKPESTARRLLDVRRLHALGWHHRITLEEGIRQTSEWFVETVKFRMRLRQGTLPGQKARAESNA